MNGETTTLAEEGIRKALLAPEGPLLRLAPEAQLAGRWFFEIKDLRNVAVAQWEPL